MVNVQFTHMYMYIPVRALFARSEYVYMRIPPSEM